MTTVCQQTGAALKFFQRYKTRRTFSSPPCFIARRRRFSFYSFKSVYNFISRLFSPVIRQHKIRHYQFVGRKSMYCPSTIYVMRSGRDQYIRLYLSICNFKLIARKTPFETFLPIIRNIEPSCTIFIESVHFVAPRDCLKTTIDNFTVPCQFPFSDKGWFGLRFMPIVTSTAQCYKHQ